MQPIFLFDTRVQQTAEIIENKQRMTPARYSNDQRIVVPKIFVKRAMKIVNVNEINRNQFIPDRPTRAINVVVVVKTTAETWEPLTFTIAPRPKSK